MENNMKYVCSRGILKSCDIQSSTPSSSIPFMVNYDVMQFLNMRDGTTIYICSTAIPHFIREILPKIKNRFILVSGDCDESVPYDILSAVDFEKFIAHPLLICWYAQNCITFGYEKLRQLPIGLDYHTMCNSNNPWGKQMTPIEQEMLLVKTREQSPILREKICKAYANFHFSTKGKYCFDRKDALAKLNPQCVFYEPSTVERKITWENQVKYAFVVSPHGNGLDCHRTWEALCLGCIPIVKTSPLDFLYDGLPVLVVDSWSHVSMELLERTQLEYSTRTFSYEKLRLEYWMKKIRENK